MMGDFEIDVVLFPHVDRTSGPLAGLHKGISGGTSRGPVDYYSPIRAADGGSAQLCPLAAATTQLILAHKWCGEGDDVT